MATLSSNLAWRIPWTEEPGSLQFIGLQRIGHNSATEQQQKTPVYKKDHVLRSWGYNFNIIFTGYNSTLRHAKFILLMKTKITGI